MVVQIGPMLYEARLPSGDTWWATSATGAWLWVIEHS